MLPIFIYGQAQKDTHNAFECKHSFCLFAANLPRATLLGQIEAVTEFWSIDIATLNICVKIYLNFSSTCTNPTGVLVVANYAVAGHFTVFFFWATLKLTQASF